jgi:hypothetical protein
MHRATLVETVLVALGAIAGGSMYHLQRDYVLAVLAEFRRHGAVTGATPAAWPVAEARVGEVPLRARSTVTDRSGRPRYLGVARTTPHVPREDRS